MDFCLFNLCFACLKFGLRDFTLMCSFSLLIRQNIFLVLRDFHGLVQVIIPQEEVIEDFLLLPENLFDMVARVS